MGQRDYFGDCCLHFLVDSLNFLCPVEVLKSMLNLRKNDLDINMPSKFGNNILYAIASSNEKRFSECIPILFQNFDKININYQNFGNSALMIACRKYNEVCVNELLKHPKIDVNLSNQNGDNALFMLPIYADDIFDMLLKVPTIDVNFQNTRGKTILMRATSFNRIFIVQKLLNMDYINISLVDRYGKIASDYAKSTEVSNLFEHFRSNKRKRIE